MREREATRRRETEAEIERVGRAREATRRCVETIKSKIGADREIEVSERASEKSRKSEKVSCRVSHGHNKRDKYVDAN